MKELFCNEGASPMFAEEIYGLIKTDEVRIHQPFIIEAENILATYIIRERIQREVTKKEVVLGYEVVLPNLAQEKKALVAVFRVSTKESSYLIFADDALRRIIGILKFPHSNFDKEVSLGKDYREQGLEDSGETFDKGKGLKE